MFKRASYPMQPPPPSIFIMGLDDSFIRLTNSIWEHTCTLVEHQLLWISLLRRYTNLPQSQCPLWGKKATTTVFGRDGIVIIVVIVLESVNFTKSAKIYAQNY